MDRLATHRAVSARLAACSDDRVSALLDAATPVGAGIGGTTLRLEVDGVPVFVKRVRLTDLERLAQNVGSTANLFGLPAFCHVGVGTVGGPGFGAWREVATHARTTRWVLAGDHAGFPLTYHWRVLPDSGAPLPDELADVDAAVAYWGGGSAVRHRIEALRRSTASVVLFLEHLPATLHTWLADQVRAGDQVAERACALVEEELEAAVAFMGSRGLLHLDAHFENVLTDGERLYVADYGLTMSRDFALSPDERELFDACRGYDQDYVSSALVGWLAVELYGCGREERRELVRSWAGGVVPHGVPAGVGRLLARHAPVAAAVGEFQRRFQEVSRATPYPAAAIRRAGRRDEP